MSLLRGGPTEFVDLVPGLLSVERRQEGDRLVVSPIGELDVSSAERLHEALIGIENDPPKYIVLDLSRLTFIDSAGLRLIVSWQRRCAQADGATLELRRGSQAIQRVFQIAGLERSLPFVG